MKLHRWFSKIRLKKTTLELRNGDFGDRGHEEEDKSFPVFFAAPGSDPNNKMHLR